MLHTLARHGSHGLVYVLHHAGRFAWVVVLETQEYVTVLRSELRDISQ